MTLLLRSFLLITIIISSLSSIVSQGLPPGWGYGATPSTHIISFPVSANPNINGFPLLPGDYIGVFYLDNNGNYKCGGAAEWLGDQNTGIIAFGNDGFTPVKDGFAQGEVINYRYYSWAVQKEYDANVTCNSNLPTTCSQFVSNGLSGVETSWAEGFYITISATATSICAGNQTQLIATPSGGSGNYSYSWSSNPSGFNSTQQSPFVSPLISTSYTVVVSDGQEILSRSLNIGVTLPPTAFAGISQTICETGNAQLNGSQSNGSSFSWVSAGDGTFNNASILAPIYFPGLNDITNGLAGLSLVVQPVSPCNVAASSEMNLQIIRLPQVDAGNNQVVCESEDVFLSASVLNAIQVQWTSNGDGVFANPTQHETFYTPGMSDLLSGEVILLITANAINPCVGQVSDLLSVQFSYLPIVEAGSNQVICESGDVLLNGSVSNADSFLWVSIGDGTFENANSLQTTYFPGFNDIANGNVTISLTAQSVFPCSQIISDNLLVSVVRFPVISVGDDATICQGNNYQISANASGFDDIFWITDGDGQFSDPFSLNTLYVPGQLDIQNQGVNLTLVAQPQFPCIDDVMDGFNLSIQLLPEVNAGADQTSCTNTSVSLLAQAFNYQSVFWTTLGDGTFNNPEIYNPVYFPGVADYANGNVVLSIQATAIAPCLSGTIDQVQIIFQELPIVDAGQDLTIMSNEVVQLSATALNHSLVLWATDGDGTYSFFDILNPVYTPGIEDINNTIVILSITAFPITPCLVTDTDELVLTIDTLTSVNEWKAVNKFNIFPNPTSGQLNIQSFNNLSGNIYSLEIYDDKGQKVLSAAYQGNSKTTQYDISHLTGGIYYLVFISGNQKIRKKVVLLN